LPACGLRLTVAIAASINVIAGLIASQIRDEADRREQTSEPALPEMSAREAPRQTSPRLLLLLFAVVGATAFAYEIAWTRLLSVEIGSSTYAFTLILSAFLAGTALGGAAFQRVFRNQRPVTLATFSLSQTWIGITALVSLISFRWTPSLIPPLLRETHHSFGGFLLAQAVASTLAVVPVAVIFGFNFPAVLVLLDALSSGHAGRPTVLGQAYAANTLGAIAGSVLTGFILVPRLGSFTVVASAAAVNLLLALLIGWSTVHQRILATAINFTALALAAFVGFSPVFQDESLLAFSAALYGNDFDGRLSVKEVAATNDVLFHAEGLNESVAVVRSDDHVALRINGKVDASTGDIRTQLLFGHLGATFHPAPRRVLIVGFGSGMTVSAVARYPDVERIDCVEIEPAVLRAAPYLDSLNRGVLSDPRVHVIFDDARNFLLTSSDKYDLIISEPSNPWMAGVATLFTDEFYDAARRRLAPGGIFIQWVQAYSLAPADLRMVAATLAPHFPELTLWRADESDLFLLARTNPVPLRFDRLRSLWHNAALRQDFASLEVQSPEGLAAYFLLDDAAVRTLAQGAPHNTDDRTLLEYHAPKTLLRPDLFAENQIMINQLRTGPLPGPLDKSEFTRAMEAGVRTALDLNDPTNAQRFLSALQTQQPESASAAVAQARLDLLRGALTDAKASLETALTLDSDSPEAMHWLVIARSRDGQATEARSLVDEILKRHPDNLDALTDQMELAAERKDFRLALVAQMARMKVLGDPPPFEYCRLGSIWIKMANLVEAELTFLRGTLKDPYSYACSLGLGELYRASGRLALARQYLEKIIREYPNADPNNYKSLADVYSSLGDVASAKGILRKGHRVFPDDVDLRKTSLH
ncbi:MAG TPA: fused MFS/spermidine synthase, partial [Candidatus Saccharimonadales bacterium]|nr:fused MFS/spermidine synthase [Candidatus Saccharimonadales bacterium]